MYGLRILEAKPAQGMIEALKEIKGEGIQIVLISHKTRTPYKGPAYDLRDGARKWLKMHGFFEKWTGLDMNQVILED